MVRYAIISDIHGNLEALKAVFEDIDKQSIDRIICLGDTISKGSHGHECLELIKQKCDAVVKGNNDIRYTKSLDEIAMEPDFDYDYFYWTQKQLTAEDIQYLRKLPMCCEFYLSGRLVRCFHASPSDFNYSVFNFDSYQEKIKLFEPSDYTTSNRSDISIYGHTHHISYEKMFGRILVNVGSVGNSLNAIYDENINTSKIMDTTTAEYVILSGEDGTKSGDVSIEFRNVSYDKKKELENYSFSPKRFIYEDEILYGLDRNPERIEKRLDKR